MTQTVHSPLGASGAERWINCPGSNVLLKQLNLGPSDESDYAKEGTSMHEAAAYCLREGVDTWEIVGREFYGVVQTEEMAAAVQIYLDAVRPVMDDAARTGGSTYIEYAISSPVHKDFYGQLDFGAVVHGLKGRVEITDFKGGEGLRVDAEDNPQMKYYAFGLIDGLERAGIIHGFPDHYPVVLRIVQGRWYDPEDRVREWTTTVGAIKTWIAGTLVPAMERAEVDERLQAGDWCRFCPAKLACPLLHSLFQAAARHNPKEIPNLDNDTLGRSYALSSAAKHYITALEKETFRRLQAGQVVLGTKLVNKRANRVYKNGAEDEARELFGAAAFTKPELMSPPQLEKLSKEAQMFVGKWAFTPESGLTVAIENDSRPGVIVRPTTERLAEALAKEGVNLEA